MNIAFYAPLKPPDHPNPSGDRAMARSLISIMGEAGFSVDIACGLRTFDKTGTGFPQLEELANKTAACLLKQYRCNQKPRPDLWFTYHPYYKSPDWIGPAVSKALQIPYVAAELSLANKRAGSAWALGHRAVLRSIEQASLILCLTKRDQQALNHLRSSNRQIRHFPPFVEVGDTPADKRQLRQKMALEHHLKMDQPWLFTAAMMRNDVKKQSYAFLIKALSLIREYPFTWIVAGDGEARPDIEKLANQAGLQPVFLGRLEKKRLDLCYQAADLFLWPGFNEAFGLVYLEAQAACLPVIALDEGAVHEMLEDRETGLLVRSEYPQKYADAIHQLMADPAGRLKMGEKARAYIASHHERSKATNRLRQLLNEVRAAYP